MMINNRLTSKEYEQGVKAFLDFSTTHLGVEDEIRCPCVDCINGTKYSRQVVWMYLIRRGMPSSYITWVHHGEHVPVSHPSVSNDQCGCSGECMTDVDDPLMGELPIMFEEIYVSGLIDDHTDKEPNGLEREDLYKFIRLFEDAQRKVYPACEKFFVLSFVIKMLHVNVYNKWSNKSFDMGMQESANLKKRPTCDAHRYKLNNDGGKKIPHKVLRYFPLTPRLKRLYMSKKPVTDMTWHNEKRVDDDIIRHLADGAAWNDFDKQYPTFSDDSQNVRLGLATDGFNPFGNMSTSYSMWPVIIMPYNLPPWKCMKEPFCMMSLLIPGRSTPGRDVDISLQPLIQQLKNLWEHGVQTYDALNGKIFRMHVAVMWTINDFPAYDGKNKDTDKACLDLEDMRIRKELQLKRRSNGSFEKPPTLHTLSVKEREGFCDFLKTIKYPDGYAANISSCVTAQARKLSSLKSHDSHVLIQRLLPIGMHGYLNKEIGMALFELGNFFKQLCSKTLRRLDLEKLDEQIILILCKLEMIFSPAFFDVMVHLEIHLPREAMLGGLVQYRWMYPIERLLGCLKRFVANKAHPEGTNWRVVEKFQHRGIWDVPEMNDVQPDDVFQQEKATVVIPAMAIDDDVTSSIEHSVMVHVVLILRFSEFRLRALPPDLGTLLFFASVCEPGLVFSSQREGESRRPCTSARDRLTFSVWHDFWHTPCFLSLEGHCGPGDHLCGRTPLSMPNSLFSGHPTARFDPQTLVLHPSCKNQPREEGPMHARSVPLGNPPPCTSLPLFPLLCSSENCITPKVCSMDTVDHYRPSGNPTDHFRMVIDHLLSSRPSIIGRSALHVVDRPSLPAELVLTVAEGKTRHGNVFQANVCTNTSLIMFMTQRVREDRGFEDRLGLKGKGVNRWRDWFSSGETSSAARRRSGFDSWQGTIPIIDNTSVFLDMELLQELSQIVLVDAEELQLGQKSLALDTGIGMWQLLFEEKQWPLVDH
ncbi:hypothetical protein HYC85_029783 [Camellia sinensis]|uniref:Transposase-associated domain-containing protein n=1 Tax=Camellia sinensis TaxID=4442 RepID=A0A7J7FYX5_CAMSI|nr:hypothetical protein HYC85_029783 [Camellia sinensis]